MKTLILSLTLAMLALTSISAQTKLWTWKTTEYSGRRVMMASAMNSDGSGAFVLSEKPWELRGVYLLVWVNGRGKTVLSTRIYPEELPPEDYESPEWELAFTGLGKLIVRCDNTARCYAVKGATARLVKTLDASKIMIQKTGKFGGWLHFKGPTFLIPATEASGIPGTADYIEAEPAMLVENVNSVTAWKFGGKKAAR